MVDWKPGAEIAIGHVRPDKDKIYEMFNRMYIRIIQYTTTTIVLRPFFPAYAGVRLADSFPQQFPPLLTLLLQNNIYQNIKRLVYCQYGEYKVSSEEELIGGK